MLKSPIVIFLLLFVTVASVSIPVQAHTYTTYQVKPGDYLVLISMKFNVSWQSIARLNNITAPYIIYPNQVLLIPPSPCNVEHESDDCYRVVNGDTLYSIGLKYHVSWEKVARVNGITPPYLIYPGEMIYVPGMDDDNSLMHSYEP